ncbi:hypothetical protein [Streptomyces sp. NEAU-S77]|uniref:hypothetical protein n=1 Tax=Streptomyces sp. NEAU-S77 TaxID=3411033 RepID=UPI003B9F96A6
MTACAFDAALTTGVSARPRERSTDFTITPDRSYGARLTLGGDTGCWFPERWTLDGPEPYAVPLPGAQPEEPDSEVLPLSDGQVLIHRRVAGHHAFSLLYPTGPGTGERVLGGIDRADVSLLPPAPGGTCAYALGRGPRSTSVWLIHGGARGLQHLAEVPGRCTGGAWLDRMGRLLALDRELDGRTKTIVVDLGRGGETSPLLQITERSNDRLLLADPDSGLLLVRSDAPGDERLGWCVLGSTLPVRFPDCLRPPAQATATPFAIQPGQMLTPEACAVAIRIDAAAGGRPWVGVWRPSERRLRQFSAPEGWLAGSGLWSRDGELWLPYATRQVPCGLARVWLPEATAPRASAGSPATPRVIRRVPRPAATPARGAEVSGITPWRKVSGEGTGADAVTHASAGHGVRAGASLGAGAGTDPRADWGAGASFSAGAGVRRSLGAGADTSPGGGTDPGGGLDTGARFGAGASFGTGARVGADTDLGADASAGARVREGTAPDAGAGPDTGADPRAESAGADASAGLGTGARFGAGASLDTDPGASAGAGLTPGARFGASASLGTDPRAGWGAGARFGTGARVRGSADPDAGASLSAGAGARFGDTGASAGLDAAFGAGTGGGRGESGVEPWVGTGCWPGVEQETGQESELTVVAPRPVPLQQAPLARSREPRPPRWVRDHRPG